VLDSDGNRLAGKYYGDFLKQPVGDKSKEELRTSFEKTLQQKIAGIAARPDAAEVVTCQGRTAVFCGGGAIGAIGAGTSDVRVVHIGPPTESELVLAYLCEGMYDALSQLMGGSVDRTMVLDNLELVFLLIDEHCDGGIILEVDGTKLASAVLLRDDDGGASSAAADHHHVAMGGGRPQQGLPAGAATGELTVQQALMRAGQQFMANLNARDGM
jgi:hypothetical protein